MPAQASPAPGRQPSAAPDKSTTRRPTEDDEARPYVIVSDIGKGSFATVYKGYHEVRIALPFLVSLIEIPRCLSGNPPNSRDQIRPKGYPHIQAPRQSTKRNRNSQVIVPSPYYEAYRHCGMWHFILIERHGLDTCRVAIVWTERVRRLLNTIVAC